MKKHIYEEDTKVCLGYTRVSRMDQVERQSLETQRKAIQDYCVKNNLNEPIMYTDEGKSGMSMVHRQHFLQLMEDARYGNYIIVYELSRFCRDQKDFINSFRDLVRNKKCTFICLNPFIDSRDSTSDLFIGIYSSVAQEESKRVSERVKSNMNRLSKESKLICRPPFGYVQNEVRKFVPEPEQQEVLSKMHVWLLGGCTLNQITKRLNEQNLGYVLNNNKKMKLENPIFHFTTVDSILRGHGYIKDDKIRSTYQERVDNWNIMDHKKK